MSFQYWFEQLTNKLERKYGRYAIPEFPLYIVGFNAFIYILNYFEPNYVNLLTLNVEKIFQGQIWRLFTYIFIPPATNFIFLFFALYFLYLIGKSLESEWGSFRLNLYYLIGMFCTTAVGFCFPNAHISNIFLNTSLFLAFATLYPDFAVYLFFIIPIKVKYLAALSWFFIILTIALETLAVKLVVMAAMFNYFLFFGASIIQNTKLSQHRWKSTSTFPNVDETPFHKCFICGKTEIDGDIEFRVCNVCSDDKEYCLEHLKDHEHK